MSLTHEQIEILKANAKANKRIVKGLVRRRATPKEYALLMSFGTIPDCRFQYVSIEQQSRNMPYYITEVRKFDGSENHKKAKEKNQEVSKSYIRLTRPRSF